MSGSSECAHLIEPNDLGAHEIEHILRRAHDLAAGAEPARASQLVVGNLFLSSSLRTRLGFATAAVRLGWTPIDLSETRWDPSMSSAESFEDTLRTVSGMVDLAVVRAPVHLLHIDLARHARCPVINGGDLEHHPTQAIIDTFAIEELVGPVSSLTVALVGDATMRASRSLLQLFGYRPPRRLVIIAPPSRSHHGVDLVGELGDRTSAESMKALEEVDVVIVTGLAPGIGDHFLEASARADFAIDGRVMRLLRPSAIVLSPLPVIDEIGDAVRSDPRIRMFDESDLSVHVRVAILEHVAEANRSSPARA